MKNPFVIILNMSDWTTVVYALLPHPSQPLVLAQRGSGKVSLPNLSYDERVWVGNTRLLKPSLEKLTAASINILHYVALHLDEEMQRMYCVHLLENRDGALLSNDVWQPLEKILEDNDMPSGLHRGLNSWQEEQQSGLTPERRAPWALPGWHARAERWIMDQVMRLERGAVQSIEPIKSWSISCVFKVATETGVLYFKASRDLPFFVNEGSALAYLGKLYPERVPVPLALEPERGWMLLDDFGDPLGRDSAVDQQARMMQDFARLQIDSSQKIEALLAAGCTDRRIESLHTQLDPLFEDELVVSFLTEEERSALKEAAPRLKALTADLLALPIPVALLHGDLHAGNVIRRDDSFLYFDWTDAAISHPFFDMIHIFMEEDDTKKLTLQEAYLSAWEEHYTKADVRRAWEVAGTLYGLYHAVSYQKIAHGIEELVQPELNFAYYFLRKLLEGVKKLENN